MKREKKYGINVSLVSDYHKRYLDIAWDILRDSGIVAYSIEFMKVTEIEQKQERDTERRMHDI